MNIATRYAGALALSSRGSNETSQFIAQKTQEGLDFLRSSTTFGFFGRRAVDELWLRFEECREANWDGYNAEPVAEETYQLAAQVLKALLLSARTSITVLCATTSLTLSGFIAVCNQIPRSGFCPGRISASAL